MIAVARGVEVTLELRARLADLYCDYDNALNDGEFERWPELFIDACVYKVLPRQNYERGLPVAVIYCESRDMLIDRVVAIRETALYAPRTLRRSRPCRTSRANCSCAGAIRTASWMTLASCALPSGYASTIRRSCQP